MRQWHMRAIAFILVFILLAASATYAFRVFEVNESGRISLAVEAEDPDSDLITYTYTLPLNASGEWQTTYGDAGTHTSSITASDGLNAVSETIIIVVGKKEERPTIDVISPPDATIELQEGKTILLSVNASDLNKDALIFRWFVDQQQAASGNSFEYEAGYNDEGQHSIVLSVSDGTEQAMQAWSVSVQDEDVDNLFENIRDIAARETDIISMPLPSFDRYRLRYEISEPIGNDNLWQSGYEDAGSYNVTVFAHGKGYERKKTVHVSISNKDRPPTLSAPNIIWAAEDQPIAIALDVKDPDNDTIMLDITVLPDNAHFEDDVFIWTPDFDTVQKQSSFDAILESLRLLSRTKTIEFVAESNNLTAKKISKVVVRDVNRPFSVDPIQDIIANEGQEIIIEPQFLDPDHDKVIFAYSGFMKTNRKLTTLEDAGVYVERIMATDGFYRQTFYVTITVRDSNRPLAFKPFELISVNEGVGVEILLIADDGDNDDILFSSNNLPKNAQLQKNRFAWVPSYDTVRTGSSTIPINITASDGKERVSQELLITVENVNRKPKIANASTSLVAMVDEPIIFEVNAVDEDNDALSYIWDFGLFEKYEGSNTHERIFTEPGEKKITLRISDGTEISEKTWNVEVIE